MTVCALSKMEGKNIFIGDIAVEDFTKPPRRGGTILTSSVKLVHHTGVNKNIRDETGANASATS